VNVLRGIQQVPFTQQGGEGSFESFCLLSPHVVDGIGDRALQDCTPLWDWRGPKVLPAKL
jgi:hypothetical protein